METNLKRGDIVYWKPDDTPKTKEGKNKSVVGIYMETDPETGEQMVVDCISWDGDWYGDGVIFTKELLGIPPDGLKYRYWAKRKSAKIRDGLITEDLPNPKPDKEEGD